MPDNVLKTQTNQNCRLNTRNACYLSAWSLRFVSLLFKTWILKGTELRISLFFCMGVKTAQSQEGMKWAGGCWRRYLDWRRSKWHGTRGDRRRLGDCENVVVCTVRVIRQMDWTCGTNREKSGAYMVLDGKSERNKPFWKPRLIWKA
jgi:hypothetical protein